MLLGPLVPLEYEVAFVGASGIVGDRYATERIDLKKGGASAPPPVKLLTPSDESIHTL
jgi:hypothetical protein